ncbi:MAG: hypothetical protein A4E29_00294 [Methanomassiliicoccales archaeon PtaB.Bin134]|nr:MAG: hypothetical protein A4E29_00294 [Methanomassiliicoccales archaeon PtaB.Bin134]
MLMTKGQSVLAQQCMPVIPSSPVVTSAIHEVTSAWDTLAKGVPMMDRYGSSMNRTVSGHFLCSSLSCHRAMRLRLLRMISAYASS